MTTATITFAQTHQSIPVEKGYPLVGCLPQMANDPLGFFRSLAERYDDVVEFKFPFESMALVTSPDLCHQILSKQNAQFRKSDRDMKIMGSLLGNGLVTVNNVATHKTHRKLVQPGFHFRRIEQYANTMIAYSSAYLDTWKTGETRDISDDMFKLTMYIVSKTLFDTDMDKMTSGSDAIGEAIHAFQNIADARFKQAFQWPEWLPIKSNRETKRIRQVLDDTVEKMIADRRLSDGTLEDRGDLLSMLLNSRYEDETPLDRKQLMDELITLFVAGHETTSNALTWTFYLIAKYPEVQARLQKELDLVVGGQTPTFEDLEALTYTEMVIKESMRLYSPVWTLNCRQANDDVVVGDYLFPKDKVLFISPYANHYNPRFFKDPDAFDPERFSPENEKLLPRYAFMPFGGGPRVCIGNSFAMMEAKLILASFAKRYSFSLTQGLKVAPQPQITLSNENGMQLKVNAR